MLFAAQRPSGMVPHIVFRRDDPDYFPGPSVLAVRGGAAVFRYLAAAGGGERCLAALAGGRGG